MKKAIPLKKPDPRKVVVKPAVSKAAPPTVKAVVKQPKGKVAAATRTKDLPPVKEVTMEKAAEQFMTRLDVHELLQSHKGQRLARLFYRYAKGCSLDIDESILRIACEHYKQELLAFCIGLTMTSELEVKK